MSRVKEVQTWGRMSEGSPLQHNYQSCVTLTSNLLVKIYGFLIGISSANH